MTWATDPTLHINNAEIGGSTVDGTFVFSSQVRVETEVRTQEFFQSDGATAHALSSLIDFVSEGDGGEGIRQEVSLDFGGGINAWTLDYQGATASSDRWGDSGNGGTQTDATGEDIHAQMCVLDKYLNSTTIDSDNPAVLEVAEYSEAGRYDPISVVPENPNAVFDSQEQSSVFDGSITLVETADLREVYDAAGLSSHG